MKEAPIPIQPSTTETPLDPSITPTPAPPNNSTETPKKKFNWKAIILSVLLIATLGLVGFFSYQNFNPSIQVSTFEECVQHPEAIIRQTYPETCAIPDIGSFIRELTPEEQQNPLLPIIYEDDAINAVKTSFPETQAIYKSDAQIGKSMDINTKQIDKTWKLQFWQGSGDCPSGCINDHYWYFLVSPEGKVEQIGEYERIHNSIKKDYDTIGTPLWDFLE